MDNNGNPLAGGKVDTFEAGTSTPKTTFTTEDESVANANPVILDASGRADIWLDSGAYKFVIKDSSDVTIKTVDNVTGDAAGDPDVIQVSTNTSVTTAFKDDIIECTAALTLSLLDVSAAEEGFVFTVKNSSAGSVIIDPDAAELIDGASTKTIGPGGSLIIVCTGTAWLTFSEDVGTTNARTMTFSGGNTHSGNNTFTGTNSYSGVSTHTATVIWSKGADVASAGTTVLGTDGNYFVVTGTNAITDFTVSAGTYFTVEFAAALTFTDGASLTLPSNANITTVAGDTAQCFATADDVVIVISYNRTSGEALAVSYALGVAQATTSGTVFDFTIPAGANRITVMLDGCSLSGSDEFLVQLGDAGGIETSGYSGGARDAGSGVANSAGFLLNVGGSAGNVYDCVATLTRMDGNKWSINGTLGEDDVSASVSQFIGNKTLSAEATTVRLTRTGSNTFDAGSTNASSE